MHATNDVEVYEVEAVDATNDRDVGDAVDATNDGDEECSGFDQRWR